MSLLLKSNAFAVLLLCLGGFILGIGLSLSLRYIKYSEFVPTPIIEVDPTVAYQNILDNPDKYILIDVRSNGEYTTAHASSSVNLPIHYMYDDTHGLKNELGVPLPKNTDQEIYLLCTGGRLAGVAYSYLEHYGYRNIKRVEGGITNWAKQGLPVITKPLFNSPDLRFGTEGSPLDKPYVGPQ
jgi:rhodanese-related sulfurtransferase